MDFYVSPDSLALLLPKALVSCQQMHLTTIDATSLLHLPAVAFFLGDWGPGGHLRHAHSANGSCRGSVRCLGKSYTLGNQILCL